MDMSSVGSIQALVLVIAVPALIGFGIHRGVRAEKQEGRGLTPGFKGWLLVLVLAICFAPVRLLAQIGNYYAEPDTQAAFGLLPGLMAAELAGNLALVVMALAMLVLTLRRSRWFRRGFVVQFALATVIGVGNLLATQIVGSGGGTGWAEVAAALQPELRGLLMQIAFGAAWVAYVLRSRRVAMTFTR